MTVIHVTSRSSFDEVVAEMDRRGAVIERLEAGRDRMSEALKGMIGLCQLVRNRGDLPVEARQALTHNHRIIAAYEALSAAGFEGFQPSDFDAHKKETAS